MTPNELINAYVTDVALRLPRRQRNDVAFELRALLYEELHARADDAARTPDSAMALALLSGFGHPGEVAARYRPALTIIDPADGHRFVRASTIGLLVLWGLGLLARLQQPLTTGSDALRLLGQWWGGTVLPSFWWPGALAVGFGVAAWSRRRFPQTHTWKPRDHERIHGGRTAMVMAMIGIVCGLCALIDPRWLLDVAFQGRAAPAAYQALTYADTFLHRQAPWLLIALLLNLPLFAAVIVRGRWTPLLRRLDIALSLLTCALMLWVALDGPVFVGEASDRTVKALLVLTSLFTLGYLGMRRYRSVRPTPGIRPQASH